MNKFLMVSICVSAFAIGETSAVSSNAHEEGFWGGAWQSRMSQTNDGPIEFETKSMEFNSEGEINSRHRAGEIERDKFGNIWIKNHKDETRHDQANPPLRPHRLRDTDCEDPSFLEKHRLRDANCDNPHRWKPRKAFKSDNARQGWRRHRHAPEGQRYRSASHATTDMGSQKTPEQKA